MKIRFIINPNSGTQNQTNIQCIINKYLDLEKFNFDCVYTEYEKHASALCKQAINEGIDIIAAVGGDGTVNECAKVIIGSKSALAIIPCGSGDGFALHLNIKRNIRLAIQQLNNANFKTIDSCIVDNHKFVNIGGVGYDAHIAHLFKKEKRRGLKGYILKIIKELNYKSQQYTLKYDNKERMVDAFLISWANGSQYGNHAFISPKSKLDDGLMEICILHKFPLISIFGLLIKLFSKTIHNSKYFEVISCREIEIKSNNQKYHIDGEPLLLNNKIHIRLNPKSLKLFTPNA